MKKRMLCMSLILILLFPFRIVYAKRGCCSSKGGVAYCGKNGHYICKNGEPSPSCSCDEIDVTTYEKDKANGDLYYGNEESITVENNNVRLFDKSLDYNGDHEEKNSIMDYIGPIAIVTTIVGSTYIIGKKARKINK